MNDKYSICNLGLDAVTYKVFTPYWDDVYYKNIIVWNRNSTDISSINSFGSPLNNEITMNIISYHPLSIDTIKPGYIKSLVTFMDKDVSFIVKYNTEIVYDNSQQINWVTGYDITLPDKYIGNLDVSSYTDKINSPYFSRTDTTFEANQCEGNCYQCFSGSENDCISCKTSYLISGSKCTPFTGYYFKVPTLNKNLYEKIVLNQDLTSYSKITIIFFMKFLGSIEQRTGIVPILYFYQDKNYLGWDIERQTFIINILDENCSPPIEETIFSYNNSRLYIGKWSFFSISILISDYQSIFPNMIQFMIDDNIIQPEIDITNLNQMAIKFDEISINNQMSAIFYDLRIYNKFYIGSYGIGQESYTSSSSIQSFLIKRFSFKSSSSTTDDCVDASDIKTLIGTDLQCLGDNNLYDNPSLVCEENELKKIDDLNEQVECYICDDYCSLNYCTSNTTKNCTCSNEGEHYWLRYNYEEEKQKFYCEKPDSININEYNDIIINDIGIGSDTGYTIEFWFYVESYIDNSKFEGVEIIWEHFLKININYYQNELVKIDCFPYSDNNDKFVTDKSNKYRIWNFYRCQVDKKEEEVISGDNNRLKINGMTLWSGSSTSTTLTIKDNSNSPYGIFLLRELRLYNSRNIELTSSVSHLNMDVSIHYTLIHYFKANFTDASSPRNILYDYVTKTSNSLTYKDSNYLYSYISTDYSDLILCEEGYEYDKNTGECVVETKKTPNIREDIVYTTEELLSKIDSFHNQVAQDSNSTVNVVTTSKFNMSEDGNFNIQNPTISDSYCSQKGIIQIVQTSLACYCIGDSLGQYCHLKAEDYTYLESMNDFLFDAAKRTYKETKDSILNDDNQKEQFINSLNRLVSDNRLYCKDTSFVTDFTQWFDDDVIDEIKNCDLEYIKLVDNLFSTLILLTNTYKAGLISNNKGTKRNADLNKGQEEEIDSNILLIKKHLEYLTSL